MRISAPRGFLPRGALWFFSIFRQSKQIVGAHAERRGNEDDVFRRRDALSVLPQRDGVLRDGKFFSEL